MKKCNSCNTEKNDDCFHKRKVSPDGLSAKCKDCQSEYDRSRNKLEKRVAGRSAYQKTERGIERSILAKKRWAERNPDKIYQTTKRYREEFPMKYKAHGKVAYEIKNGNLVPEPCEVCGSTEKICAHHDDYAKPLNVRWLCAKHHHQWHKENGEGANAS
jgi:hypothetical protein